MPSTLAQRIAVARRLARISQQALANILGVSRPAVSQWESVNPEGRTTPEMHRLQAIAEATQVPLDWLLDDSVELALNLAGQLTPVNLDYRRSESSSPVPPRSQPARIDPVKLNESVRFLEQQFALWGREFVASERTHLIAAVYDALTAEGNSNLVSLSQWLAQQLSAEDSNVGQGEARSIGSDDRRRAQGGA